MCSDTPTHETPAIQLAGVGKRFYCFERPLDRLLLQLPWLAGRARYRVIQGLAPLDLTIGRGEVIGLVGHNGAGKSTLLQLVCKTLAPSSGTLDVNGKVAALLELGSGFNPEFTGRENVFMSAAIAGLSRRETEVRFADIHAFSGIGDFIHQPVKTYSSGMYVRLAFAVAISVDPDILVVDEALSVGDGAFARKSFERIMQLKAQGKTILFCSHSLYQIEALCSRALWLHQGKVVAEGAPAEVVHRYEQHLYCQDQHPTAQPEAFIPPNAEALPRFTTLDIRLDDTPTSLTDVAEGTTDHSELTIEAHWQGAAHLPTPTFAITLHASDGRLVGSAGSHIDAVPLPCNNGAGHALVRFPRLPLLKGDYWLEAYLLCENGIMFYDQRVPAARLRMASPERELEQGVVHLTRKWLNAPPHTPSHSPQDEQP